MKHSTTRKLNLPMPHNANRAYEYNKNNKNCNQAILADTEYRIYIYM